MNVKELMIGDWVQGLLPDIYSRVCGIINEYRVAIMCGGAYMEVSIDDISPIPLTEKILEKNGFIPATNGVSWYLWEDDTNECLLKLNKIHNAFVMSTAGMTIGFQYVHELQHLFRLCGIKKEFCL